MINRSYLLEVRAIRSIEPYIYREEFTSKNVQLNELLKTIWRGEEDED